MKKKNIAMVFVATLLLAVSFGLGVGIGYLVAPEPKEEVLLPTPSQYAEAIISEEEEGEKKEAATEIAHTVSAPQPMLGNLYIEGDISFEKTNTPSREVVLTDFYGEKWSVWLTSLLSFRKTAYATTEVTEEIWLMVYLQPKAKAEGDDSNNITIHFILFPPKGEEKRWVAQVRSFSSKTQGEQWFPLSYNVFRSNWQKAEILYLAKQVLDAVLKSNK